MQNTSLQTSQSLFESIKHVDDNGHEYWLARELMPLLDYQTWESFHKVINKAKIAIKQNYPQTSDLFRDITKKIKVGSGSNKEATREIKDYKLSRLFCYVIAQNGDPSKPAIANAQAYFAIQTRKQEVQTTGLEKVERLLARKKLTQTEKKFSSVLTKHGVDSRGIASIRSAGDKALFNKDTKEMKQQLGASNDRPLADFIPTITLKAKDLATEMTTFQTKSKNLYGKDKIKLEHIHNNKEIRNVLSQNGIYPELLPAEEDIKHLEKRIDLKQISKIEPEQLLKLKEVVISLIGIYDGDELESIKNLVDSNPGSTKLKILYGSSQRVRQIIRNIELNNETIVKLKPYLVINKLTNNESNGSGIY